jgi:antitoxin HigA-1
MTLKRGLTGQALSRYFNNSPQFWLGLQMDYELDVAEDKIENKILNEVKPRLAVC